MPAIGLIVEGEDDEFSYKILLKRIKPELEIETFLLNGFNKKNLKEMFKILNKKLQQSKYSGVEKGLIICDCDGKCAPEKAVFIKNALGLTNSDHKIEIHATCEELETLFLTCIEDVEKINGQIVKFKQIRNPVGIIYPKECLSELLLKENIIYGKKVAEEIASQINIDALKTRLRNFNRLHQIINNLEL